jgi:hypothetical protein
VTAHWVRRLVVAALCAAGLVALAGPAASAGGELTKAEFIAAADELCTDTDQYLSFVTLTLTEEGQDLSVPPTDAQLAAFTDVLVPAYRDLIDDLRALDEPRADRAKIKKLLKTLSKEVTAIEDDPLLLRKDPLPKSSKLAKRYGFEACGGTS